MRFLAIGGEPCTGKSTLMRAFLSNAQDRGLKLESWRFKCLRGAHCPEERWLVLGIYPECAPEGDAYSGTFCGTDRLAFVAKRDLDTWLSTNPDLDTLLFEGDRLFNAKTLRELAQRGPSMYWMLQVEPTELANRRSARPEAQTLAFLKRQATKSANLLKESLGIQCIGQGQHDLVQRMKEFTTSTNQ